MRCWSFMEGSEFPAGLDHSGSPGWCAPLRQRHTDGDGLHYCFRGQTLEAVVELKRGDIYSKFIDKFWRAVCVRLLGEMLEALKDGRNLYFGDALVHDDGVTLVNHKFLGANERVRCTWGQVQIWSANGSFCIGSKDDKMTNVSISYIDVPNTHILEQLIRMAFKTPGLRRLSELLQ